MIKNPFKPYLNRWRWRQFKNNNSNADGLLKSDLETVLLTLEFLQNSEVKKISRLECREISVLMAIASLYDLLYFLRECSILQSEKGFISARIPPMNTEVVPLSTWLSMPEDAGWIVNDLSASVDLVGSYIKAIYANRGDSPNTYLERRLSKVLDCFMTMVEVLGDRSFT
jgi:hypothetical protein